MRTLFASLAPGNPYYILKSWKLEFHPEILETQVPTLTHGNLGTLVSSKIGVQKLDIEKDFQRGFIPTSKLLLKHQK